MSNFGAPENELYGFSKPKTVDTRKYFLYLLEHAFGFTL